MRKYMIIEKQSAEGCDYSIGCGMRFKIVEWDGPYNEFMDNCARYSLYGGDQHGSHEDYGEIEIPLNSEKPSELYIVDADYLDTVDLEAFAKRFNQPVKEMNELQANRRAKALAKLSKDEIQALGL